MHAKLNKNQIEYIFYHLNHHFVFTNEIKNRIIIDDEPTQTIPQIRFQLSCDKLDRVKYIDKIPILFPINDEDAFYKFDDENNLIFNDDLMKSAFYLLSGFQELNHPVLDKYERFSYQQSIQKKLNIAEFPLVNHYFKVITEGIEKFCLKNNYSFSRRNIWQDKAFGFLLTHDVDRVDKYNIAQVKLKIKQLFGLSPSKVSKSKTLKLLITNIVRLFGSDNPFWNFDWLKSLEIKYGFRSVWFFLPQGDPHKDAYFSFDEQRIKEVVNKLIQLGDEIGLHATYNSFDNEEVMKNDYNAVKKLLNQNPSGSRQHWLRFNYPNTLRILEKLEIKYDSTWGFHDQIGWRNSYCLPFRPYDVEQDRMMNIWEFPLTVMDTTLFEYLDLSEAEAEQATDKILNAVESYGGLFVLLGTTTILFLRQVEI
ncbi:MAG: polysaccharide deacetylase family protein [Melioribacteraceae bacterium]|nr:polysaccharide deacetylase family protein [Melioribacteraceae bacterium]